MVDAAIGVVVGHLPVRPCFVPSPEGSGDGYSYTAAVDLEMNYVDAGGVRCPAGCPVATSERVY